MSNVHTQTLNSPSGRLAHRTVGFRGFVARVIIGAFDTLLLWQQRASERADLARLTDFQLKDVGLTRSDVEREASKPFWQA